MRTGMFLLSLERMRLCDPYTGLDWQHFPVDLLFDLERMGNNTDFFMYKMCSWYQQLHNFTRFNSPLELETYPTKRKPVKLEGNFHLYWFFVVCIEKQWQTYGPILPTNETTTSTIFQLPTKKTYQPTDLQRICTHRILPHCCWGQGSKILFFFSNFREWHATQGRKVSPTTVSFYWYWGSLWRQGWGEDVKRSLGVSWNNHCVWWGMGTFDLWLWKWLEFFGGFITSQAGCHRTLISD